METVVYVALLGLTTSFFVNSFVQIASVYSRARAEREVLSNARTTLEAVTDAISSARAVYAPTSRFNTDAGQVSLVTDDDTVISGEPSVYTDFWVDGGRIFERKEGGSAIPLSASSVRVSEFRAERIVQALGRESVKMTIRMDAASDRYPASVTLNATTALRGNY